METMISKYETDQYADTGSVEGQEVKLPDDNAREGTVEKYRLRPNSNISSFEIQFKSK